MGKSWMANEITSLANSAYADGPTANPTQPPKSVIRQLFALIQSTFDGLVSLVSTGTKWALPVRVATTANFNLASGLVAGIVIDGVTMATGDRVLIYGQTTAFQNGIYNVAASGAASRSTDADTSTEMLGLATFVSEGTANGGKQFVCITPGPITLGTTSLSFREISNQKSLAANIVDLDNRVDVLEHPEPTAFEKLLSLLNNPLRSVMIAFIADSIGWGFGASGTLLSTPRNHSLSDVRNTVMASTCPSFVNLIMDHLRVGYNNGPWTEVTDGSPPLPTGVGYSRKVFTLDPSYMDDFHYIYTATGLDVGKTVTALAGTLFGHYLILHYGIGSALDFDFTGTDISIVYSHYAADASNKISVSIDGGTATEYVVGGGSAAFSQEIAINTGVGGPHHVRIINLGPDPFRLEAIRHNRWLYIANQGIIGTTTTNWLPTGGLLGAGVTSQRFDVAFVQLGTNNRALGNETTIHHDLVDIGNALKAAGIDVILMTPPVTLDADNSILDISVVADEVFNAARELGASVIDNYRATIPTVPDSTELLNLDLLHPCDPGHWYMYANIVKTAGIAGELPAAPLFGYPVASLPDPTKCRSIVTVTNEVGGEVPAFSDGTNWRRMTDRAIVSA